MCEAGYDLKLLLKNEENIITETKWGKSEADRCPYAWEKLYIPYFLQSGFWKEVDFSKAAKQGYVENGECKISGDVVFNFGKNKRYKRNQKFEYFAGLLERNFAEHNYLRYLQELEDCNALNYSIYNLSFMPVTGALNNFKGTNRLMDEENGQKLDRGDKFIYRINDFYENKSMEHIIFSNTHGRKSKTATAEENTQKLKNVLLTFLDKLNDVNGYCKYMYLIDDKKYIRKLVEEGQEPIMTGCDVVRYMKLAEEYWMIKYNKINEMM